MKKGRVFLALLLSYAIWGMQPLYWSYLRMFDSMFILCVRIVMSVFFTWLFLAVTGRLGEVFSTLKDKQKMKYLAPAALFLLFDWGIFIWAATSGHVLDASLGYYMNPMVIFLAGVFLFKEKGHVLEYVAVGLACTGVAISTIEYGAFPATAAFCAFSWPIYATIKKAANADPIVSIAVESGLMLPFVLVYALIFCRGEGGFATISWSLSPWLICSGIVTALPMILYTYVVNDLPFKVVGVLQYAGTTLNFLCGVLFINEKVTQSKLVMFIFIWAGLIVFTIGSFRRHKQNAAQSLK